MGVLETKMDLIPAWGLGEPRDKANNTEILRDVKSVGPQLQYLTTKLKRG